MSAQLFDIAVADARRYFGIVPAVSEDRCERAMHNVHESILDFENAIRAGVSSARLSQLEQQVFHLMNLWCRIYEQARDKRQALQDVGR
jgi:hypothetical protein